MSAFALNATCVTLSSYALLRSTGSGESADTGDTYLLRLFHSYVFHATDGEGRPWLDMSHIIQALGKVRGIHDTMNL